MYIWKRSMVHMEKINGHRLGNFAKSKGSSKFDIMKAIEYFTPVVNAPRHFNVLVMLEKNKLYYTSFVPYRKGGPRSSMSKTMYQSQTNPTCNKMKLQ